MEMLILEKEGSMGRNLAEKIIDSKRVFGDMVTGERIGVLPDQSLSHDLNVIMTYLALESMGIERVRIPEAYQYIDHNMIQSDYKNADDHRYILGMTKKLGIKTSRSGAGICHYLHLEHHAKPGRILIGGDSHTPTAGGVGALGIGVGGFDNALVLAGEPFYFMMPEVVEVKLVGSLNPFVGAKDVVLELLRRVGVKGGTGKIYEYTGPGVSTLNVNQRATIADMGAETGATSSLFPIDDQTILWLEAFGRRDDTLTLEADLDCDYADTIIIDLSVLEPSIALPSSPDKVVKVTDVEGTPIDQVMVGSCTNTSAQDLETVASFVKGKVIHSKVELGIYPSSKTVVREILKSGAYVDLLNAGSRFFEPSCGGCNGCGFAPATGTVSLRTTPRNFPGRSGTIDDQVYLCGPEVAAASSLTGVITDPRKLKAVLNTYQIPSTFTYDSNDFVDVDLLEDSILKGPNISTLPIFGALHERIEAEVVLKCGDNTSTDMICPAGATYLPIRSNIPEISKYSFHLADPEFYERARNLKTSFLIAGHNYGQGSSREQAAIIPRYLGIQVIVAKSFARLHLANLVNWGILPLVFEEPQDYDHISQGDTLIIEDTAMMRSVDSLVLRNQTKGVTYHMTIPLFEADLEAVKVGGRVNLIRNKIKQSVVR